MRISLLHTVRQLRAHLRDLDPSVIAADECASLAEELAGLGNACDAARARCAVRAEATGAFRRRGFIDAAEWLAVAAGTTAVEARRALDTATALSACPSTEAAWAAGELSVAQAGEIAKTEAARPGSERELLSIAKERPLRVLRETAQHRRLSAIDTEELAAGQRKARHFRHWHDDLGMTRISGAFRPADGAAFLTRLDAETERIRRAARRAGAEETWEAHASDALVAMAEGGLPAGRGGRKTDVVIVCDLRAYRRGQAHEREPCHVINAGPIPVSEVQAALNGDAFLKVAFHDGVEVQRVTHFGRHVPAELRSVLDVGPPPDFGGLRCGDGCGKQHKIQIDHVDPVAHGGPTSLGNLEPRVADEHVEKTKRDRRAGLLGGPVRRPLFAPDDDEPP